MVMRNSSRNSTNRRNRRSGSIGDETDVTSKSNRFFIPGINGRARCLEDDYYEEEEEDQYIYHNSTRKSMSKQGSQRSMEQSTLDTSTSSRRSNRSSLSCSLQSQKDENFAKMLQELKEKRKAADVARKNALKVKRRFERMARQRQGLHNNHDKAEDVHLETFERNMAAIRKQLRRYGN